MSLFEKYRADYAGTRDERMSLLDYLELCREDPRAYASAAERMLAAIGEPETVDTSHDPRLSRIFSNRVIQRYPAFAEFHGMEEAITQIVSFFRHAAQGLEERKQVLYLLGPVGGGKSSIAERLKALMEKEPIYALEGSPINESPLGLFDPNRDSDALEREYGIPRRYLTGIMSPWAVKRLEEYEGDITKFSVVRVQPSVMRQVAIAKTEPGDENNQDISSLVGKVDIRKLESYAQDDPRCLQLLRRTLPRQPGPSRVRRDVQGADQDAAPAPDGDAGGELQGHRGLLGDPVPGAHPRPLERVGMADVPEQQEQRGVPRPDLHRQGAVLPAGDRGDQDLREAPRRTARSPTRPAHRARST